jgi:signal transduction histidine kinase/CheY-like chemotaxis protein/HPt (histidine-containing phosphotransfer) domain-containing protein
MKRKDMEGWPCSTFGAEICKTSRCSVECLRRGEKQIFFSHNGLSLKANVEMLRDLNGETAGYIEVFQDVTEISTMAKRQAETEAASNAKSAFLATVSHEIRTPMNTILGIAEIQLQNEKLPAEVDEAFSQICDSGGLLLNIINDILDLSKIEAGKLDIVPIKYDIPSLINDSAQLNYLRYESKPIKFNIILDSSTPLEFFGDEFRIKQIFNNLLSNSFKYTDKGEVELSVSASVIESSSENGVDRYDTMLNIRVSDTGVGMNSEQIDRLFDEFTRFGDNRTIAGTGLGMSITKRLVDMMQGEIKVESTPDKGSVFTVTLPQKRIGENICGAELSKKFKNFNFKSRARLKKAQIIREYMPYGSVLIVDDVSLNLQVAKGMMIPYSLKIETVLSGIEAIELIKAGRKYDIIFMDHMMPVMNGVEVTKVLRETGYDRPIVALTANALAGQEDMFMENGFDGFISKPIDSRELNVILNDFIRNKQPKEVVEAARHEQQVQGKKTPSSSLSKPKKIPGLEKFFVKDAEKAVVILENLCGKAHSLSDNDVEIYITTVHGMKSALANIGEKELSKAALKLEQAGQGRNFTLISNKTPVFVSVLKSLIDKYMPKESEIVTSVSGEDADFINQKLLDIKAACASLDKQTAKNVIGELREKPLPERINKALDEIETHLLHSAFKKAAAAAEEAVQ